MKKFTQTTLIALLMSTAVFSQKQNEPTRTHPGGTSVNQATNPQLILLSPADGTSFSVSEGAKPVLFRWAPIVPKPKEAVIYRIKVWQLMQGQNNTEALRSNQPIVTKDVANITQVAITNLYTGPCKPPYLCDFVWAVEVLNSDDPNSGKVYGASSAYSFKVNTAINERSAKAQGDTGISNAMPSKISMPGRVTQAQGDPIHGVDVKLGVSEKRNIKNPENVKTDSKVLDQPVTHPVHLPIEKITYDAAGNIVEIVLKPTNGAPVPKIVVSGSNSLSGGYKQESAPKVLVAGSKSITGGYTQEPVSGSTAASNTDFCEKVVFCRNPNHPPGCGWTEIVPCGRRGPRAVD